MLQQIENATLSAENVHARFVGEIQSVQGACACMLHVFAGKCSTLTSAVAHADLVVRNGCAFEHAASAAKEVLLQCPGHSCTLSPVTFFNAPCKQSTSQAAGLAAQDYPEHRLQFFSLLRAITNACFVTLFAMSPAQLRLVIDSIVWAFRHTERNVADTGLCLLLELLTMFERSDFATQFHQTYYLQLVQEIFAVMTGALPCPATAGLSRKAHQNV